MSGEPKWWFPKRIEGDGWGMPVIWQGWVVFGAFLLLLFTATPLALVTSGTIAAGLVILSLVASLSVIVMMKGEPLTGDCDEPELPADPAVILEYYRIASYVIAGILIVLSLPSVLAGTAAAGASGMLSIVLALLIADWLDVSEMNRGKAVISVTALLMFVAVIYPYIP
jgi:hypothetical protein